MTEEQAEIILREIYGFLQGKGIIGKNEWATVIEPRIEQTVRRVGQVMPAADPPEET